MSLKIPPPSNLPVVGVQYDAPRNLYWVPVSPEFLAEMVNAWSEPLQVRIENGEMTFRRPE